MNENLNKALTLVFGEEGGLADHPDDPGDRTNLGITEHTLRRARLALPGLPDHVDDLTRDDARRIYERFFWVPSGAPLLPPGLDVFAFDSAIQHDPRDAVRFFQLASGLAADGVIGPKTRAKMLGYHGNQNQAILEEMAARRNYHYMNLDAIDQTFGLGWSRRIFRVFVFCERML